jgi:hypothetical protein
MIAIDKGSKKDSSKAAVESLSSKAHKAKAKQNAAKKMTVERADRLKKAGVAK